VTLVTGGIKEHQEVNVKTGLEKRNKLPGDGRKEIPDSSFFPRTYNINNVDYYSSVGLYNESDNSLLARGLSVVAKTQYHQ